MIVSAKGRLELESIPGERTAYGTNYDGRFSYEMEDLVDPLIIPWKI